MKSVLTKGREVVPEFPKLMVLDDEGLVVLMRAPGEGTVVNAGNTQWAVGHYNGIWNKALFSDFLGEVTLSN